jgi:hypothetical protein
MIPSDKMIAVPAQVLQDLIWNCELAVAGMGTGEKIVGKQCRALQEHIDREIPTVEELVITLDNDNVIFGRFGRQS